MNFQHILNFIILLMVSRVVLMLPTQAQPLTPYPGSLTLQGQTFTSGLHWYAHPGTISSPGNPSAPVDYSGSADVKYQSATGIVLKDGFHAHDFQGNGQFYAKINPGLDMVLVTPDPATSIINGVVHVPKWEKLEIAMKLPQEYMDAIDRFFLKCFNQTVNPLTDLNPYAFDSLEVRFDLVSPSNISHTRYAFFMREAGWDGTLDESRLTAGDPSAPINDYKFRFRFSPDEVSSTLPWTFQVTIRNPQGMPGFPEYVYSGLSFICDPNLPDNHGYVQVSPSNNRYLQFEDGTPFFAIGENIPDVSHGWADWNVFMWYRFYRRDFEQYMTSMDELASVGANYISTSFYVHTTALEYEHLGIYDSYGPTPDMCPDNTGYVYGEVGNRQYNAWVMDQLINKARETGIYIQLVIDPTPPGWAYQKYQWGGHAYMHNYVYNAPLLPPNNTIDTKRYFISEDPVTNLNWANEGSMYYWKRRYQYIMSRWGYSTNIAMIQPFKELDAVLNYKEVDMTANSASYSGHICSSFVKHYLEDPLLKVRIRQWHDIMIPFVRSTLGFNNYLFTVSYAASSSSIPGYFDMFSHSGIDVIDIHSYDDSQSMNANRFDAVKYFYDLYIKPVHFGECSSFQSPFLASNPNGYNFDMANTTIYQNYDQSFHNMIWATSIMGACSNGLTWQRELVHWWEESTPPPPQTPANLFPTNVLNLYNHIIPNGGGPGGIDIYNRKYFHQFFFLTEYFNTLNSFSIGPSSGLINPRRIYNNPNFPGVETYYCNQLSNQSTTGEFSYGWIHNNNKYWATNFYVNTSPQLDKYYECENTTSPISTILTIKGVTPGSTYDISFYATRFSQIVPSQISSISSTVCLDDDNISNTGCLSFPIYLSCDTLEADYAFIVAPHYYFARHSPDFINPTKADSLQWQLSIFPNPATDKDEFISVKSNRAFSFIEIFDITGRKMESHSLAVKSNLFMLDNQLNNGVYFIKIDEGMIKLIIL